MLYRIAKILNHNSFMGIQDENNQECLVMGKGVAFGKKVGQTVPVTAEAKVYSLKEMTERGEAKISSNRFHHFVWSLQTKC